MAGAFLVSFLVGVSLDAPKLKLPVGWLELGLPKKPGPVPAEGLAASALVNDEPNHPPEVLALSPPRTTGGPNADFFILAFVELESFPVPEFPVNVGPGGGANSGNALPVEEAVVFLLLELSDTTGGEAAFSMETEGVPNSEP